MLRSIFWKAYSHIYIVSDGADWALDQEAKALEKILKALQLRTQRVKRILFGPPQVVHYTSQFALSQNIYGKGSRISIDYFHGKPELGESYRQCFESLKAHHEEIARIRVSTSEMESLIKTSGIDPLKVFRIPIGIDTDLFTTQTIEKRLKAREKFDLPPHATVIGSFQKDGVGWAEGLEPKLIKGPDIFLQVVEKLKETTPNLYVLLSGPARGFVKNGLEKLKIPYRHYYLKDYAQITELYDALDLYLITSREEGGPKACLEAMVKGVPLVTTTVGQCRDLVKNGENAMMAQIDDVEGLRALASQVLKDKSLQSSLIQAGHKTAQENSYKAQLPLWKEYFEKLITS